MRALLIIVVVMFVNVRLKGQPNCEIYNKPGSEKCYKACSLAIEASQAQGTRQSQLLFDDAINLCPTLDYAYFEKSVPFIKRGDIIGWKPLIDKAVELNPQAYLGYRGWCKFQFLRDYTGALKDIEALESYVGENTGYSQNGDYSLAVVKALCLKGLGDKSGSIVLLEKKLSSPDYNAGLYDYLHLGILKIETGDLKAGISALEKQIIQNDYLADTYFYLGMASHNLGKDQEARTYYLKAREFYNKGMSRKDPYTHPMDKVYLSDIEQALKSL